jgi:hypothetical protein
LLRHDETDRNTHAKAQRRQGKTEINSRQEQSAAYPQPKHRKSHAKTQRRKG